MSILRSLLFFIIYWPGTVILISVARYATFFKQDDVIRAARRWAIWHKFCAREILGITSEIHGELPQYPVIVAIKHESRFETIELLTIFDRPAALMKKELWNVPVWGAVARAHGSIAVDREAGGAALRHLLVEARQAIAAGRPIIIFPEGTRALPGMQPALKPGLAGLYKLLNLPIVPIALQSGTLWPRHGFIRYPGKVIWHVGDTIPAGLPREEVEARVHRAINAFNH